MYNQPYRYLTLLGIMLTLIYVMARSNILTWGDAILCGLLKTDTFEYPLYLSSEI